MCANGRRTKLAHTTKIHERLSDVTLRDFSLRALGWWKSSEVLRETSKGYSMG